MAISQSCSFNGSKLGPYPPPSHNLLKSRKYNIVSCRSTKLGREKETTNFYKVLSVHAENVSADEIKKAYRTMALQYHPDVCHPSRKEECTQIFVELQNAYEVLSDPVSRRKYDSELVGMSSQTFVGTNSRGRWEDQLCELTKRSDYRVANRGGYRGKRMRPQSK